MGAEMESANHNKFSRGTVVRAVDVLGWKLSHAQLSWLLVECGAGFSRLIGDEGMSIPKRCVRLMQVYDEHPDLRCDDGSSFAEALVYAAVRALPRPEPVYWDDPPRLDPKHEALIRALALDGYSVADGDLRSTLPADIGLPATLDELTSLLDKHGFVTSKGHLIQALDAHASAAWASANAQIRAFLDSLLDTIAEAIDPAAAQCASGQPRRAKLVTAGFLSRDLNEWDDVGKGYINGLSRRLHPHGAHPGLSNKEDSTFRLHTVLLTAALLLRRFDQWPDRGES